MLGRSLGTMFADICERAPDDPAFEAADGSLRWTRRALADRVARVAELFDDMAVGSRVILALPNTAEFPVWFWGCQVAGIVPVPVAPPHAGPRLAHQIASIRAISGITGATAIVLRPGETAQKLRTALAPLRIFEHAIEPGIARLSPRERRPEDLAFIQFTSGSTSNPKGCALAHRSVAANVEAIRKALDTHRGDVSYNWMPYHHDMGLLSGIIAPILCEGTGIIDAPRAFMLDPIGWLRKISAHANVHTTAPNFALSLTLRAYSRRRDLQLSLENVRSIICGAEPIEPELVRRFLRTFAGFGLKPESFVACYGMAESTVLVSACSGGLRTFLADATALEKDRRLEPVGSGGRARELVSLGTPPPECQLKIVEEGREVAEGQVGEIWLRSPSLMQGYFSDPEATEGVFQDGYLKTGDNGLLLAGELFFVGRRKDILIVSGQNFDPHDIELQIAQAVGLEARRISAINVNIADRGSTLGIVLEEDFTARQSEDLPSRVIESCFNITGVRPKIYVLRGERLPRTSSGKIQRAALALRFTQLESMASKAAEAVEP